MQRTSIYTSTTISSKTTTLIGTDQKSPLKKNKKNSILFNSFQKRNSTNNIFYDYFSSKKHKSKKNNISDDEKYEEIDSNQKDKNKNYSKIKHKKISRLPYNIKNNELLKLKFLNNNMKSQKLPKFSSDSIADKLKKDIDFPNVNIIKKNKKNFVSCRKFSFLSSDKKILKQKCIYLNNKNEYISFGLYYDKDIIDKSKELNEELIENSDDLDNESDEENIINGINICFYDLKYAIKKVNENNKCISYVKNNKAKLIN